MTSVGRFSNVTEIRVSDKIPILTSLVLPHGTQDVTLVVGSDVTTDNVFSVCDVEVSYIGINLNGVQTTPSTVSFQRLGNGSYQNPSTTIDLGTITNSGSSVLWNASEVRVLLHVVVTNSSAFTVGGVYSVIGDATLDNGAMQFLASLNFTAVSQNPPSPTSQPLISLSGPTSVKIGDVANLTLMLTLVDPYNALRIEARVNGTYTFPACDVILDNIGKSVWLDWLLSAWKLFKFFRLFSDKFGLLQ
ncbi:uncharacterized protein LOC127831183 [Dreissena polymorpha]|uniref:uncharacterized protein LOC127831183 n=1 Tax=Dreissena polymorpha TaxID=45954 RepID=UPI002263C445|nr:uncharacterized protein LOC127831183 [Dreissena polymorpha]